MTSLHDVVSDVSSDPWRWRETHTAHGNTSMCRVYNNIIIMQSQKAIADTFQYLVQFHAIRSAPVYSSIICLTQ